MDVELVPAEITYGLDRLAMAVQGKRSAFELEWAPGVTWGEIFKENERQWSIYNFEEAPVDILMRRFDEHESECRHLLARRLPLPAYDQVLKLSHTFNLLDARGAIGVTERAATDRPHPQHRSRRSRSSTWSWRKEQMPSLLLEIGCEELPASACYEAERQLPRLCAEHFGAEPAELFIGPRRLAALLHDLPERTEPAWIKGPPEEMRERAAAGSRAATASTPASSR